MSPGVSPFRFSVNNDSVRVDLAFHIFDVGPACPGSDKSKRQVAHSHAARIVPHSKVIRSEIWVFLSWPVLGGPQKVIMFFLRVRTGQVRFSELDPLGLQNLSLGLLASPSPKS